MLKGGRFRAIVLALSICLVAMLGVLFYPGRATAQQVDPLQQATVWRGSIYQGNAAYPATITILTRSADRITGEIQLVLGDGAQNILVFQGNVIGADTVVWITDRKTGNVTSPGLYFGHIVGDRLTGVWQVPSVGQYDRFEVSRVS